MSEARAVTTHGGAHPRARSPRHGLTKTVAQNRPLVAGLDARVRRPATRSGLVHRSDLVDRLLRADDVRVVLLIAGAGFGKTTLLTQWAERDDRPFAWVSVDDTDDDPTALVGDITDALDAVDTYGEDEPQRPGAVGALRRGALSRPWLAMAARTRPFVLVLDDLHALRAPRCLALLTALVDNLPPGC